MTQKGQQSVPPSTEEFLKRIDKRLRMESAAAYFLIGYLESASTHMNKDVKEYAAELLKVVFALHPIVKEEAVGTIH